MRKKLKLINSGDKEKTAIFKEMLRKYCSNSKSS